MRRKLCQWVGSLKAASAGPLQRRRSLLALVLLSCLATPSPAQVPDPPPLDTEQRQRLRRELREAHRLREAGGHAGLPDSGGSPAQFGGDAGTGRGGHHDASKGRWHARHDPRTHDHAAGPGHDGFPLSAEERRHLRRQLREQGSVARIEGAPPARAPLHPHR